MAAVNKTTTPASTTVKVSGQTGAAKDDLFAGISEDSSSPTLNVLANDPGSAYLWSIDQNALNAPAGSQQPEALGAVTLTSGGRLSVNADGTLRYEGAAALQSLAEGELFADNFIYTIRMANGALSTAKANVQVIGKNDVATFSGDTTGSLTEDQSSAVGKLNVSDIDHDQSAMQAATLAGDNGNLAINAAGNWTFNLARDMNYLAAGESVAETFTVKAVDGTEQAIAVTIVGVNDVATFAGKKSSSLTENASGTSGTLIVSDLDHDQSAMQATTLTGDKGSLTLDAAGSWAYALTSDMNYLAAGESVAENFTVKSIDGTEQVIAVKINGVNDVAIFSGNKSGTLSENASSVSGKLTVIDLDHDQSAVRAATVAGSKGALVIDTAGNWTYGLTSDMNYLAAGESVTEKFTVKSVDGTKQVLTVKITGVNDIAIFSGNKSGALSENDASVTGKLTVSDLDHDQSATKAVTLAGKKGALVIDTAGNWTYALTRDMNYLAAGESVTENFTVKSVDGTRQPISVKIIGANDAASFGGVATGAVQEDGTLTAAGVLTVSDADHDQSVFAATGKLGGAYGDFTFNLKTGGWTYALRNDAANVQSLTSGQAVQDKLSISSRDGSTSDIIVTIGGADEPVVVSNPADKWNVNKNNVTKSGGGLDSQLAYDGNGVATITGFDSNDTLHPIGAMNQDSPFMQLIDTDNSGGADSTLLNFNYSDGGGSNGSIVYVDVILVGYTGFTSEQLQAQF